MRITLYVPKIVLIQFMSFCIPMYENERKILLFFSYNSSLFNEIFLFFHGPMEKAKKKKYYLLVFTLTLIVVCLEWQLPAKTS